MWRRKFHFCLAFLSCFVVTLMAAIIGTVLDHAPLIFLKLAESGAGEIDIYIEPEPSRTLFNYVHIEALLGNGDRSAPRISFDSGTADCISDSCKEQKVTIMFIDTEREKEAEIGKDYSYDPLPLGSCLLPKKIADSLQLHQGDTVRLYLNDPEYFFIVASSYNSHVANTTSLQPTLLMSYFDVQIFDIISSLDGKVPDSDASSTVVLELSTIFALFSSYLLSSSYSTTDFISFLQQEDPHRFVTEVLISMSSPRTDHYINSNYEHIQSAITKTASEVMDELGFYPVDMQLPVLEELSPLRFVEVFLGIILNLILFILFFLSVILIYALLMISVETKTYELGVIRVLGLNKIGLAVLILTHTLMFVIPAIILGIFLSIPANTYISNAFKANIGTGFDPMPTANGAGNAILLGFLLPIIASMMPLYTLLTQELSDSLDIAHNKSKAVSVQVETNNFTARLTLLTFGIVTVLFGVSIYYILPLALLSMNIALFLGIFLAVLIAFLLGLVLLSLNAQFFIERFIVYTLFLLERTSMRLLILKNLAAHRIRNRKTTIMYAISLSFIIFLIVNFDMQMSSSLYSELRANGQKLVVNMKDDSSAGLPVAALVKVVEKHRDIVDDFAWSSIRLDELCSRADATLLKNNGKLYEYTSVIRAVSPNIFDVLDDQFLEVTSRDESGLSLSELLYTGRGSQGAILGATFEDLLSLDVDPESTFLLQVYDGQNSVYREMRPLAFVGSAPGFFFSKYPNTLTQSLLVSFPVMYDLAVNYVNSIRDIPIHHLYLKLSTSDNDLIDLLYTDLNDVVDYNDDISIYDYRDAEDSQQQSANLMGLVFFIVTLVAMFLCFFSLVSSMIANLFEQSKELAVLRAVGMTKIRLSLLYVYESFVVVLSSGVMGIVIGTAVAWTMWAQQMVFTDLPVPFVFPYTTLAAVLVGSIICSFASSFVPAYRMLRKQVAEIMRLAG